MVVAAARMWQLEELCRAEPNQAWLWVTGGAQALKSASQTLSLSQQHNW